MAKLIQYATKGSYYDGPFGGEAGWAAAGMGYLIVTDNGKLIVIDGGDRDDGDDFYSLLQKYGGTHPVIDSWIITHPHIDHYGALLSISERDDIISGITVKQLVYYFPEGFTDEDGDGIDYVFPHFDTVLGATKASYVRPSAGDIMTVDGVRIDFLYTPDDISELENPNHLSLIFTVKGELGKVMFTADTQRLNLQMMLDRYPADVLESDILQMPHHGLCDTGLKEFYEKVNAKTLLIPISVAGDRTMHSGVYGDSPEANLWAEENAELIYRAYEGTKELVI